jgi:RNA polymerase sigma-70 factor, ECF subfamily
VAKPEIKATRSEGQERLLVRAAQKDPARFAELYEANFYRVYGYIARRVHNRTTAEDLTADVFQKALAGLANFDWRGIPFAAWLLRIAANVMVDEWKRAAKEEPVEEFPDPAGDPDFEQIDQRARLFRAVEKLPSAQRRVVQMRFVEGKSVREIAQQLGRTEGAVKQLQFRALQTLRARVEGAHA